MKLHLSRVLLSALLACWADIPAMAITLPSPSVTWDSDGEPIYNIVTGSDGSESSVCIYSGVSSDSYQASDTEWNIGAGTYTSAGIEMTNSTMTTSTEGTVDVSLSAGGFVYAFQLDSSSTLINNGTTNISSTCGGYHCRAYGISGGYYMGGSIVNETSGTLTVNVRSNGSESPARAIFCESLENKGSMSITASSSQGIPGGDYSSAGIFRGTVANSGTLDITASNHGFYQSEVINRGTVNITQTDERPFTGIDGGAFTNEAGSLLTINAFSTDSYDYENRGINDATVINRGKMEIASIGKDAWGIQGGSLVNEAGAELTIYAKLNILTNFSYSEANVYGLNELSRVVNYGIIDITTEYPYIYPCKGYAIRDVALLYNGGHLKADNIYNGATYLLHASTTGAHTNDKALEARSSQFYLGGILEEDGSTISAVEGGSLVTISSALSLTSGSLSLQDDVTLAMGGDLTVDSSVTHAWNGYTLTVDNGGSMHTVTMGDIALMLDSKVSFTEEDGSLSVELRGGTGTVVGGSLQTAGSLNVGSSSEATVMTSDTDSLSLRAEQGGSLANTTLEAGSISVAGGSDAFMELEDVTFHVLGGELSLENAVVSGAGSVFTTSEGQLTLKLQDVTFRLDDSNSRPLLQTMTFSLEDELEVGESPDSTFFVYSSKLDDLNISGSFTLDLSAYADEIQSGGYGSVGIMFADNTLLAEGIDISATLDGVALASPYLLEDGTMYFAVADMKQPVSIPEPTTATLSLLALTALAARRRRK